MTTVTDVYSIVVDVKAYLNVYTKYIPVFQQHRVISEPSQPPTS